MLSWWSSLDGLNQGLYVLAFGCTLFFLWQVVGMMLGLGGGEHDVGIGHDAGPGGGDVHGGGDAASHAGDVGGAPFQLFSVRSIAAFLTIFAWASALHMNFGYRKITALSYGLAWGFAALVGVALLIYWLMHLQHSGNLNIYSAVGLVATVHLDVPPNGMGEIRVMVGGVLTHLRARSVPGSPIIKAGALVKVTQVIEPTIVEVALHGVPPAPAAPAAEPGGRA